MESPEPLFNAKGEDKSQSKAARRGALGSFAKRAETANPRGRRSEAENQEHQEPETNLCLPLNSLDRSCIPGSRVYGFR